MTAGAYDYWNRTRNGERVGMLEDKPEAGFYRYRSVKIAPWQPVAIFYRGNECVIICNGNRVEPENVSRVWVSCARHPISEERCRTWLSTGKDPEEATLISHNNPPADKTTEAEDIIAEAVALASKGISTEAQADDASRLKRQLTDSRKKVYEDMRAAKKPHEEAAAEAAKPFNAILNALDAAKEKISAALTPYLKTKQETLKKAGTDAPTKAGSNVLLGGKKRSTTLRTFRTPEIVNRKEALAFFGTLENPPADFDEAIITVTRRMDSAGLTVPGTKINSEERAV